MNDSNDEDFLVLDAVDDPIAVDKVFTEFLITKLWYDASGIWERRKLAHNVEDLVDYSPCLGRRITIDILSYGINVIESRW